MSEGKAAQRSWWFHGLATAVLIGVVWWAFHWQLSALQWLGLLLIAIVLWHALQGSGAMRPAVRWTAAGVVAAAVIATLPLDQPWNAPWWPGSNLAGSLPDPCDIGSEHTAALVPDPAEPLTGGYADLAIDRRSCGWRNEDRLLYLEFRRYPWQGTSDTSVPRARRAFAERRDHADAQPLAIGEEAYRDGNGETWLTIEARRANVIVNVKYSAEVGAAVGTGTDAGEDAAAGARPLTDAERVTLVQFAEAAAEAIRLG